MLFAVRYAHRIRELPAPNSTRAPASSRVCTQIAPELSAGALVRPRRTVFQRRRKPSWRHAHRSLRCVPVDVRARLIAPEPSCIGRRVGNELLSLFLEPCPPVSLHHRVQLNHCWIRHTLQLRDNAQHFFLLVVRTGWLQGRSRAVWVGSTVTLRLPPRKKLSFCAGVKLSSNRGRFVNFAGGSTLLVMLSHQFLNVFLESIFTDQATLNGTRPGVPK